MPKVRCHFFSVVMKTFKSIWYLIAMFVFNFLDNLKDIHMQSIPSKSGIVSLVIIFLVILLIFIFNLLKWWNTKIYIEDDTFILERKQISQNKITVKLSSISTVNLQQNVFEKIFDLYTLQFDINSSATADKTDFNLVFNDKTAFDFRDYILSYLDKQDSKKNVENNNNKGADSSDYSSAKTSEPQTLISFRFKDVIQHCILSFSLLGGIYALGVIVAAIWAFNATDRGFSDILPAIFSLMVAVVPILYKSVSAFFLYHNFIVKKSGDKLIISCGLFTTKQYTLPLNKTNALVIRQPFQARFLKLYYGEILNVGMGDESESDSPLFCLLVKKDVIELIIKQIAPQFVLEEKEEKSPIFAVIPTLIKWGLFGILFIIGFFIFYKWWIGVIIFILLLLCGILSYKTKGLGLDHNKISITTGVFNKRTIITTYSKIQNASMEYGPISKLLGIASGNVSILSSSANKQNSIGYFTVERFNKIFQQVIIHDSIN